MMTQRVDTDHDILGFTVDWIEALAAEVDELDVLTGYEGKHDLPDNVAVHSYGKERDFGKPRRVLAFESHCARLFPNIDVAFVHMIPNYVLAASPWLRLTGKPCVMWYAHGNVDWNLWIAHCLVDRVVTPTPESFRLDSPKVEVLGHGIDTGRFTPSEPKTERTRLLSLGRIDPVKNIETLIDAFKVLTDRGRDVSLRVVGEPSHDVDYLHELRERASSAGLDDRVTFPGAVPHGDVVAEYRRAGIFLSASRTGSLDKTEVESMACGTPVVSCNDSYVEMVRDTTLDTSVLAFSKCDTESLADRVETILDFDETRYRALCRDSREVAKQRHDVSTLMRRMATIFRHVANGNRRF